MADDTLYRAIAGIQGSYYLLTGIWPLLHMASFLAVTGPKTDLWLVRTVAILVAAIGCGLALSAWRSEVSPELIVVSIVAACGLATIDTVYVKRRVISTVYLADAVLEAGLALAWCYYFIRS